MEFWQAIAFTEPDQLVDFARSAEELGFDGVAAGDHFITPERIDSPYPYTADQRPWVLPDASTPDPLMLAATLAQHTETLRFMVTAYVLPMREPLVAAKAISTAAVLSGNRLVLGIGVGWMREEFRAAGQEFTNRGSRCDEALELMETLFRGGMVEHQGSHYTLPRAQMTPVPERPVPILVGGHSNAAFRRAARHDGWIGSHYDLADIRTHLERFEKTRVELGRGDTPRQAVVALNHEVEADDLRRLEEAGITGVIQMPLLFHGQPTSSFDAKRAAMERFAERCIRPLQG
jgi:probable F420-dependent oxidoreductase